MQNQANPLLFSLLLQDAATLLRPAPVTVHGVGLDAHPSANTLRALSDLVALFGSTPAMSTPETKSKPEPKPRASHVVHKLTFYAAYVLGTPPPMLRVLADEALMRARTMEGERRGVDAPRGGGTGGEVRRADGRSVPKSKIEELQPGG